MSPWCNDESSWNPALQLCYCHMIFFRLGHLIKRRNFEENLIVCLRILNWCVDYPHQAKAGAKAKNIKEQTANIKENFRFCVRFCSDWTQLKMYSHSTGKKSDVVGDLSARTSWNTEKASKMVIPRDTFSPESAGSQNMSSASATIMMHGARMLSP